MMFHCVKSRKKFKIFDTFNELLCYCGFAVRLSITVITKNRPISSIGRADKSQHISMFLDIPFLRLKR